MRRIPFDAVIRCVGAEMQRMQKIPVYDYVPKGAKYPYITFGAFSTKDTGNKLMDKQRVTVTIHLWTTYKGKKEVNIMADNIVSIINGMEIDLEDDGFYAVDHSVDFIEVMSDDLGYNGAITMYIDIQDIKE